jgi:hypothetical protein
MRKFLTLWLYVFGLLASIATVQAGSMSLLGAGSFDGGGGACYQ